MEEGMIMLSCLALFFRLSNERMFGVIVFAK
jgi:hypothetical protein